MYGTNTINMSIAVLQVNRAHYRPFMRAIVIFFCKFLCIFALSVLLCPFLKKSHSCFPALQYALTKQPKLMCTIEISIQNYLLQVSNVAY